MKELTAKEEKWLKETAKENGFFNNLLQFYIKNNYLSNNQYYWLNLFIKNAIEVNIGEKLEIININKIKSKMFKNPF